MKQVCFCLVLNWTVLGELDDHDTTEKTEVIVHLHVCSRNHLHTDLQTFPVFICSKCSVKGIFFKFLILNMEVDKYNL